MVLVYIFFMNYEIELKAHVDDRKNVISVLNGLGTYLGHTEKSDDYYHFSLKDRTAPDGRDFLSARIRKEKLTLDGKTENCCYFTYKRKENKTGDDGTKIEVNEENEIKCTDASALEVFFADLGAKIDLHKEKDVEQWNVVFEGETAHAELCTVPPLGDFLEIEIIKNQNDEQTVKKMKEIIIKIFEKCGLGKDKIEERYYRDMLQNGI